MECDNCNNEMVLEENEVDYYDPNIPHGHGQYTERVWICNYCNNEIVLEGGESDYD